MRKKRYYESAGDLDPALVARYYRLAGDVRVVLDVGCGGGSLGRLKPSAAIEVHGVDHDAGAVERAGLHEIAVTADLESGVLPYADGRFDAVVAKDVLEHLRAPWLLAAEIQRVLRPGGAVIISVPMEYPKVVWDDYTHIRGFTRRTLILLLEDVGFEVVHVVPMGSIPGAGRLKLVDAIPAVLRIPGMRRVFGKSWEALARRPRTESGR